MFRTKVKPSCTFVRNNLWTARSTPSIASTNMPGVDRERLAKLARANFGVFSRAQALSCGYSPYQIRRRIRDGEWRVVLGQGLALVGTRITPMAQDRAAQLSVPGSVLAALSAARTWQLPVPDEGSFLYVGPHRRTRVAGVHLIYRAPGPRDVYGFQGLPALIPAGGDRRQFGMAGR
jgi:putative AbiEi antitoxin of type IV toxin-antitoxin system